MLFNRQKPVILKTLFSMKLMVLYPQPLNVEQFESDYKAHLELFHEKLGIPPEVKPYTITRFFPSPMGNPPYFQMFCMPFESAEAMEQALNSPAMQEVSADANRISTGGPLLVMVGAE